MTQLRNCYTVQNGVVHWNGQPMPQAHATTFQHLGGAWARDAQHVFVQGTTKKIDIATFQYLNPVFVKDDTNVYDWEGTVKGADAKTFEVLDPGIVVGEHIATETWARGYARDANAVFYHDQMWGRASLLRGADPATFVSLRNDYGYDATSVWHQKSKLPKADPQTWVYLGRCWSMDAKRFYYTNREVTGIDRETFAVVHAPTILNLACDRERFFDADRVITEEEFWQHLSSDAASFETWFRVSRQKIREAAAARAKP